MTTDKITLRQALFADLPQMKQLFRDTILTVCANEYDEQQRSVWASSSEKTERWENLIKEQNVLLAFKNEIVAGFGSLLNGNYLDFMYVHKDHQRQGIAETLLNALEAEAMQQGSAVVTSDISKTARPFFEKKRYEVITEQKNVRGDIVLINYKMRKEL